MRFVRILLIWLRTRKRAATALTFDALLKRAMQKRQSTPSSSNGRAVWHPKPGWAIRCALALAGGLSAYAGVATIVATFRWGGWYWLLPLAIPLLAVCTIVCSRALNERTDRVYCRADEPAPAEVRIAVWPIGETLGLVCVAISYIVRAADWFTSTLDERSQSKSISATPSREDAVRCIPDLIVEIIDEERKRLFGGTSPFAQLRKRIERELEEARRLHAYFTRRAADAGTAERRTIAIDRAASVRDQLDGERTRLDEWRARVDAELNAYRERVQGLGPEIDELVHYRALSRLEASTAQLAAEVEAMIAEMTTDLLARVHGRCRELSGALHDASAQVAVAAADTKDADRDVRIITETVRELVRRAPTYDAKAVQEELRRSTRTAVRG